MERRPLGGMGEGGDFDFSSLTFKSTPNPYRPEVGTPFLFLKVWKRLGGAVVRTRGGMI